MIANILRHYMKVINAIQMKITSRQINIKLNQFLKWGPQKTEIVYFNDDIFKKNIPILTT